MIDDLIKFILNEVPYSISHIRVIRSDCSNDLELQKIEQMNLWLNLYSIS